MEKITSVKINNDKWQILKGRGYKLQDIIDNAFNNLLAIEEKENPELLKELEKLKINLKQYDIEKEKINLELENNIKELKAANKIANETIENKINETNFKIRELEKHIKIDKNERNKENNYKEFEKEYINIIDQLVIVNGEITHPLTDNLINDFIDKYKIKPQNDILNKLQEEFINRAYENNKKTIYDVREFILYEPL